MNTIQRRCHHAMPMLGIQCQLSKTRAKMKPRPGAERCRKTNKPAKQRLAAAPEAP